jgi:methyl coenzyme M reductase subunit D
MRKGKLSEEEYLLLKYLALSEGSAPIYYLDRFTVEKKVYEGKTVNDISREIDENQNSPDTVHFGPIMAEPLNELIRKGYVVRHPTGLYVGLSKEGLEVLREWGEEELYNQLRDKVMSTSEYYQLMGKKE